MYFIIILLASVLPEPDSPLITMHVSRRCCFISLCTASAIAKICGGFSNNSLSIKPQIILFYYQQSEYLINLILK